MRQLSLSVLLAACAGPSAYSGRVRLSLHDTQQAAEARIDVASVPRNIIEFTARCDGLPDSAGGPVQQGEIRLFLSPRGELPTVEYFVRAYSFDGLIYVGSDTAREEDGQYIFGTPTVFREVVLSKDRRVFGVRTSFWPCLLDLNRVVPPSRYSVPGHPSRPI